MDAATFSIYTVLLLLDYGLKIWAIGDRQRLSAHRCPDVTRLAARDRLRLA